MVFYSGLKNYLLISIFNISICFDQFLFYYPPSRRVCDTESENGKRLDRETVGGEERVFPPFKKGRSDERGEAM